eukprot:527715-Rhodomonas_salina.1
MTNVKNRVGIPSRVPGVQGSSSGLMRWGKTPPSEIEIPRTPKYGGTFVGEWGEVVKEFVPFCGVQCTFAMCEAH